MRLVFVIASLARGGSERVLVQLANEWAARGEDVTVVTLGAETPAYTLHPKVALRALGTARLTASFGGALGHNFATGRTLRRALAGIAPDVVVSFLDRTNVLTLLAAIGLRIPVVVSERSCRADDSLPRPWRLARAIAYPRAAAIVVQTTEAAARTGRRRRIAVVPNPVPPGTAPAPDAARPAVVLGLGRLIPDKGFDTLLDAFATAHRTRPDWRLVVWGDGPARADLEARRDRLGLRGAVDFPGVTETPEAALAAARVFALSSRVEGFPNALCEAMAAGLPVVAFTCPCGPAEIVHDGVDGILVPAGDTAAFATALGRLMDEPDLRTSLGGSAREIADRFPMWDVLARWDAVLDAARRPR